MRGNEIHVRIDQILRRGFFNNIAYTHRIIHVLKQILVIIKIKHLNGIAHSLLLLL